MMNMDPVILLDVHMEDLVEILSDKGWNAKTVTKELGDSKEARSDDNILKHAQKTKCIVVTDDDGLVQRLKASNLEAITIETTDRAMIIDKKLEEKKLQG